MNVYPIRMGFCTSYLVRDRGAVLVDAGQQGYGDAFRRRLAQVGIAPDDLTLVFLTHGHWDHIGFLGELRRLSGAPVAVNHREKPWVEQGLMPLPRPITVWGRLLESFIKTFVMPKQTFGPVPVDITLGDDRFPLEAYGVDGALFSTPGHSSGSMSLILRTGEAFVGDLAVNGLPQSLRPNTSVFAEEPHLIPQSWRIILRAGAKVVHPAHGRPFEASALQRLLHEPYAALENRSGPTTR
jgi:hydroxyacylglutathione hydrolase